MSTNCGAKQIRILSLACVMWWLGLSLAPVKLMLPRMQKLHYFAKRKKKTLIYRSYNPVKDDIVVHGFIATIARCME